MTRLVRIEWLKLRTMRVGFGVLATSAALTTMFASLEASRAGSNGQNAVAPLFTPSGLGTVTTVTGWSMILAAVLGVIVTSGEYRHYSATLTYLGTPNRRRVLAAKTLTAAGAGAIFGLVSGLIATAVGLTFVAAHGYHVALGTGTLVAHVAGAVVGAALFGAIGAGIGALFRSQLASVIGVFVWALVIESIIGGLFTSVRPYLPYTAATTLAGIKLGGAAFGPAHDVAGGGPLPFAAAAALLIGVAALLEAIASRTTVRQDVT